MSKNILITGAAGFLGSHLCDCFINDGFSVIGMDNFITGDKNNIAHLLANPKFDFMPLPEGDPQRRQPNIDLAKKTLNWSPKVQRQKGILRTFEYFKKIPKSKLLKVDYKNFSKHIKL